VPATPAASYVEHAYSPVVSSSGTVSVGESGEEDEEWFDSLEEEAPGATVVEPQQVQLPIMHSRYTPPVSITKPSVWDSNHNRAKAAQKARDRRAEAQAARRGRQAAERYIDIYQQPGVEALVEDSEELAARARPAKRAKEARMYQEQQRRLRRLTADAERRRRLKELVRY